MRYSIQIVQSGRKQPLTREQAETFDEAYELAKRSQREFGAMSKGDVRPTMVSYSQILDKQTGKVFKFHLSTWVKPTTAKIIAQTGGDYFETAPEAFTALTEELFSAEGC